MAISNKQGAVRCLMEFAGNTDSDIAVSSYRKSLNKWCRPEYSVDGRELLLQRSQMPKKNA